MGDDEIKGGEDPPPSPTIEVPTMPVQFSALLPIAEALVTDLGLHTVVPLVTVIQVISPALRASATSWFGSSTSTVRYTSGL